MKYPREITRNKAMLLLKSRGKLQGVLSNLGALARTPPDSAVARTPGAVGQAEELSARAEVLQEDFPWGTAQSVTGS